MNELRIMDLEDALQQAIWTIEFLHGCLTSDKYSYSYPEQTAQRLKELKELIPDMPEGCFHSYDEVTCIRCVDRAARRQKRRSLGG